MERIELLEQLIKYSCPALPPQEFEDLLNSLVNQAHLFNSVECSHKLHSEIFKIIHRILGVKISGHEMNDLVAALTSYIESYESR